MYSTNLSIIESNPATNGYSARAARKRAFDSSAGVRITNRILCDLSEEDFARLKPHLESVTLNAGENIYQPEEPIRFVYFPESAVVSQFYILEDGRTMEIAMVGKDGATGYGALFGARQADCFSQISISGSAFKVNAEIVRRELALGGVLQRRLIEFAGELVAQISRSVVCNNYHSVEKRFCTWLLMLSDRHGADKISLTHSQIANYLGIHRPSFTHIASALREKRVIDYTRGHLQIADRRELLESACDCYTAIN